MMKILSLVIKVVLRLQINVAQMHITWITEKSRCETVLAITSMKNKEKSRQKRLATNFKPQRLTSN